MARSSPAATPLTFDLPVSMLSQIEAGRKLNGLRTTSETVRFALAQSDLENFTPDPTKTLSTELFSPRRHEPRAQPDQTRDRAGGLREDRVSAKTNRR